MANDQYKDVEIDNAALCIKTISIKHAPELGEIEFNTMKYWTDEKSIKIRSLAEQFFIGIQYTVLYWYM